MNTLCLILMGLVTTMSPPAEPAADETVIVFMRESSFAGRHNKIWIAVNDQTVARVKNKQYAVVRAKAGRLTLYLSKRGCCTTVWAICPGRWRGRARRP